MRELTVPLKGREYQIKIEKGLLVQTGIYCRQVLPKAQKLCMVTDSNVGPLYGDIVRESLQNAGFTVQVTVVPAGETSKTLSMLGRLYDAFTDFGLTRSDAVIALGGGVVGDLAGFAAATIFRGVDFIQIPTTLLAQVDSSVGGKVAIDLPAGKNLAGAFWQPKLVLMDPLCLDTLSDEIFHDGMAEVIKYGCIMSRSFFDLLQECGGRLGVMKKIEEVLYTCCSLKARVVLEDEWDMGSRMLLNFGHTLGHAYERAYHYERYTHGQAVAAGMVAVSELGVSLGVTERTIPEKIRGILRQYELPEQIPCMLSDYQAAIGLDKKGSGDRISLVLLREIGLSEVVPMRKQELFNLLGAMYEN